MANSSPRPRRGLRVLLWAGLLFALGQLGGGLLLDWRWPQLRFPEMDRMITCLRELDYNPDIIFLGSSRFEGAVRPKIIDPLLQQYTREAPRIFNAGVPGADAVTFERLFDQVLADGRRPAMVILELNPEHISRRSRLLGQQIIRVMTWADLPNYFPDAVLIRTPMHVVTARLLPLYMHRYQICEQIQQAALAALGCSVPPSAAQQSEAEAEETELGPELCASDCAIDNLVDLPPEMPIPPDPPQMISKASPLDYLSSCLNDFQLSPLVTSALERILNRCQREGIGVMLICFPVKESGRVVYTPGIETIFQAYLQALQTKYDCRFVDLRDRLPDHCFRDEMHASDLGAKFFSYILARQVLIPRWRGLHP